MIPCKKCGLTFYSLSFTLNASVSGAAALFEDYSFDPSSVVLFSAQMTERL